MCVWFIVAAQEEQSKFACLECLEKCVCAQKRDLDFISLLQQIWICLSILVQLYFLVKSDETLAHRRPMPHFI